jgi:anti-sigma factor RsiW
MGLKSAHVHDDLLRFAERRLAARDRRRVEAHLAVCGECRSAALDLAQIADSLQALPRALQPLDAQIRYRAARSWPEVWAGLAPRLASGRPRLALPHVSLYLSLLTAFCALTLSLPGGRGAVPVTADLAQTPLVTALSTAAYGQEPPRTTVARDAIAATSAGTAARQPIPIPTPIPGPRG